MQDLREQILVIRKDHVAKSLDAIAEIDSTLSWLGEDCNVQRETLYAERAFHIDRCERMTSHTVDPFYALEPAEYYAAAA